jgi:hypothetical protein
MTSSVAASFGSFPELAADLRDPLRRCLLPALARLAFFFAMTAGIVLQPRPIASLCAVRQCGASTPLCRGGDLSRRRLDHRRCRTWLFGFPGLKDLLLKSLDEPVFYKS